MMLGTVVRFYIVGAQHQGPKLLGTELGIAVQLTHLR